MAGGGGFGNAAGAAYFSLGYIKVFFYLGKYAGYGGGAVLYYVIGGEAGVGVVVHGSNWIAK